MRKVTFGAATSLDNFIARKDGGVDWLLWNKEVSAIMESFWKTIDALLMGRRTYEVAARSGSAAYPGVKNYVFSRSLRQSQGRNVEVIREAVDFVRELKMQKGKGICLMSGGLLAHSLFEADLIDELRVNIHPVLLGSGIPIFYQLERQIDLQLIGSQQLNNGCVVLTHRVKGHENE